MAYEAINGRIYELRWARKAHSCYMCHENIDKGEMYCNVTIAGGGLGSIKFPDRVHTGECKEKYIEMRGANGNSTGKS